MSDANINSTIENIGKYNGAPLENAKETVLGDKQGNEGLGQRLYTFCKAQSPVKQLNIWWKLV